MTDFLLRVGSLWIWILLALALVAGFVVLVLRSMVRRSAETGKDSEAPAKTAPPAGGEETAVAAPATIESAAASFSRALRFLRRTVSGRDYRYQIPWFLVVGDPGSGKRSLLEATGLNLALEGGPRNIRRALNWHFLDAGILIGASGAYFMGPSQRGEFDWEALLRLFQNHRTRRPLDGIVLTVAATDLAGPTALDETQLSARAARYSEMFSQAQRALGFTFPVYVIVTRCDEIPGYSGFCRELPSRTGDDVFGWSSPYQLDAAFTAEWVDQAFDALGQDLERLQSEIFVDRPGLRDPDQVFLFPERFAQLRPALRVYLERLFRETAYREAFRFRGVYFCGDLAEPEPEPELPAAPLEEQEEEEWLPAPAKPPEPVPETRRSPAYVKKLFERKIFPENGVARPLARVFLARSRTVLAIQAGAVLLAVILGLGLWLSYRRLAADRDSLVPALRMMTKAPDGNSLLAALAPASEVHFRSVFMPKSYFAGTDEDVTRVMTYACNRWIFSALHDDLVRRKQTILYPKPVAAVPKEGGGDGQPAAEEQLLVPNIEATAEYQRLDHYIASLKGLRDAVAIYENLRQRGLMVDLERMRKLLGYLDLEEVQPTGHLAEALSRSTGPPAEITPEDRNTANDALKRMLGELFQAWFDNNPLAADVQQLKLHIVELEQGLASSQQDLKEILDWISQVDSNFSSPMFKWASSPTLDLAGPIGRVAVNPIDPESKAVVEYARQIGEGYLTKLRRELADQRTSVTESILVRDPIALSPGTRQLQLALENATNLRFMVNPVREPRPIRIKLEENTRLMWRVEPVQEALRLDEINTQFVNDGLRGAPRQLSAVLRRVAAAQLRKNIQDLTAQAQNFTPRVASRGVVNGEDETLAEVNSLRDAMPLLLQLAGRMQALEANDARNSVMRVLVLQSYNLLNVLDRRLRDDAPYAAKPGNWRGKGPVALAAYEMRNPSALGDYLAAQRSRIKFLSQQADPLVPFLNTWLPVRGEAQARLISRWQRIIEDFGQYDAKRPGASLGVLEDFILGGMDKITPENACGKNEAIAGRDDNADFFLGVRNALLADVTERCRDISAEIVCQSYAGIASLFNRTLAGKLPFAPATPGQSQAEATPDAVAEFYKLLDANGKKARSTLSEDSRYGDAAPRALRFLDAVERLRPFMVPGPDAPKEPPLALDFIPRFRVNQRTETGGNQIIDWTLQVGGQIFTQREPEHPGRWRPGNPIRLSLRWANDSLYAPASDGQPSLKIRSRNAYFEFTNRWSLLTLLRQAEAQPSETVHSLEKEPYILKFRVKTARDPKWVAAEDVPAASTAVVFMQLRLFLPATKNAIALPAFPITAPTLGPACAAQE